jgi:hypothetical protein
MGNGALRAPAVLQWARSLCLPYRNEFRSMS